MRTRIPTLATAAAIALAIAACGGGTVDVQEGAGTPSSVPDDGTSEPMHDADEMSEMHSEHEDASGSASDDGTEEAPADATVVEIEMVDVAFVPTTVRVPAGEPIRFVFTNTGAAEHEAIIGDRHVQDEHEEAMRAGAGHEDGHDDGHHGTIPAITLQPGESGELVHTFDAPGRTLIGCHVPGHYAAGMVMEVEVTG